MLNLVSDSSCDLISGELNSPYARLTVAPMCLHVGGQDYLDTPELDIPALLSKLAHHRSSSACPSPAAYAEAFEQGEETVCQADCHFQSDQGMKIKSGVQRPAKPGPRHIIGQKSAQE
mgnify:CR=1 FL=1